MDPRVEEGGGEPIGDDAIEDGGASLQRVLRHFLPKKCTGSINGKREMVLAAALDFNRSFLP
jgi:hypothetical protein